MNDASVVSDGSVVNDGSVTSDAGVTLCNGDPSVRLAFQTVGGGTTLPGSQVTYENGFRYLVVTGDCRYWAMKDDDSDVREGHLSSAQAEEIVNDWRLSTWTSLDSHYGHGVPDASVYVLSFEGTHITVSPSFSDAAEPGQWLGVEGQATLKSAYDAGTAVAGPVRFVLVEGATWSSSVQGLDWPLTVDPASLALTYAQASSYVTGTSQVALASDAEALRQLRRDFLGAGRGGLTGGYIPVLGPTGAQYQLFVRDSIPIEDEHGLLAIQ
ncbi:MAG TPA: hypothetical protein VIY56_06350 [Vicinamibacterales bacterium]